jgi:hypothetical protein
MLESDIHTQIIVENPKLVPKSVSHKTPKLDNDLSANEEDDDGDESQSVYVGNSLMFAQADETPKGWVLPTHPNRIKKLLHPSLTQHNSKAFSQLKESPTQQILPTQTSMQLKRDCP